jgi:hypothetical protein
METLRLNNEIVHNCNAAVDDVNGSSDRLPSSDLIMYQAEVGKTRIECRLEDESFWLSEAQTREIYQKDVKTIDEDLLNIHEEQQLEESATIRKFRNVRIEGKREALPHVSDVWIDHEKTKIGYEIPFNLHFYVFTPPRPLEVIDAELKQLTDWILGMFGGLSA